MTSVDRETGEILGHDCASCNRLAAELAGLTRVHDAVQEKFAQSLAQIKSLKTQDENRRARARRRPEVEECFKAWKRICDKATCILTHDRFDVIAARLNDGYTVERFEVAAIGAMHNNPWKTKAGQKPMVEIGTYASKGMWLEQFEEAGIEWRERTEGPSQGHLRLIVGGALPETPAQAVLHALHERGIRFRANGATDFLSSCPSCGGNLSVRVKVAKRGEIVGLDCYGDPPCDRPQVIFALGLAGSDLVRTRVVLNEFPAPMVLPEHLRVALEQLLARGVRVEEAA